MTTPCTNTAAPEPAVEITPSICLTQPCSVKVYPNGEHEGGETFNVTPDDMAGFDDIGELLGPKMDCVSKGMRWAENDGNICLEVLNPLSRCLS